MTAFVHLSLRSTRAQHSLRFYFLGSLMVVIEICSREVCHRIGLHLVKVRMGFYVPGIYLKLLKNDY